jgi:hypothetical protein
MAAGEEGRKDDNDDGWVLDQCSARLLLAAEE